MCQGLHLRTELLDGLQVLVDCSGVSWLVILLSVFCLHLGAVSLCVLLAGKLAESALMFILVADHFSHLAEDFFISDLAV